MAEPGGEPVPPLLRRHELLWVKPEAWTETLGQHRELAGLAPIIDWVRRGWPVIGRRRLPGDPADRLPVGVPLPPAWGKRRIGLTIRLDDVIRHSPPLPLHIVIGAAPALWRPTISAALAVGDRLGIAPAVFGSLLWQHLTGLAYLTPSSDLDLLWPIARTASLPALLAALADLPPPRIDGEIVLAGDTAINWRELWQARDGRGHVLAKTAHGVHLLDAAPLLDPVVAA